MVTKNQGEISIPITKIELSHATSSGVWLGSICPGIIPTYEEHIARIEHKISLEAWSEMSVDEKAMIIAVRRISRAMENLQAEAEIEKSEKK